MCFATLTECKRRDPPYLLRDAPYPSTGGGVPSGMGET